MADVAAPAPPAVDDLTGPALRAFFNLAEIWDLSNAEQITLLGSPKERTFYNWKKG